jgi:hypothetical protein
MVGPELEEQVHLLHHYKMDRHRTGPGLGFFGRPSVSVTQFGCAVCVSADCVKRTQHDRGLCHLVSHHPFRLQMTGPTQFENFHLMVLPHQKSTKRA